MPDAQTSPKGMGSTIMKKALIISIAFASIIFANAKTTNDNNPVPAKVICDDAVINVSEETVADINSARTIFYDGLAYSSAQDGMIPSAAGSVQVYWTDEGCSVNGESGYRPGTITGGTFAMRIKGRSYEMNHFVNYKGERYYFEM